MHDELLAGLDRKDRHSLARLITLASRGEAIPLGSTAKPARVLAITGSGGVGKSTLIGKLIEQFREHSQSVAVLACDPESPLTGGALLGDRFRMPVRPDDAGVFIRSLAARSGRQAVAEHLETIVRLCERFGFDIILIETAGAGQGDTAVRNLVDAVVLLLQPETGDDLQLEKAGLLEVADVIVVHKADLPGAERTVSQLQAMTEMSGRAVPVFAVSSKTGQGLPELAKALGNLPLRSRGVGDTGRLLQMVQAEVARRFADMERSGALTKLQDGTQSEVERIKKLLERLR
ncbi:MAG TPA: GTP-binding protein [Gemmataceae bacterium]|jgi:LAO/AO transport system ATPase|nr:GTP-binding protein [Gemmataceae bacterium]